MCVKGVSTYVGVIGIQAEYTQPGEVRSKQSTGDPALLFSWLLP